MSEWMMDENGRRYRLIGNGCREYEPEISIHGIMVPVSQADAVREQIREAEEKARKEKAELEARLSRLGSCPFTKGMRIQCRTQCAFYSEDGCMKNPDAKGRRCPISNYVCAEECMLYDNGCQIIKKMRG